MFCPQCGSRNPDGTQRCAQCGAIFHAGAQPAGSGPETRAAGHQPAMPGEAPQEIKGFNFGAFALNWIWALAHRLYLWGIIFIVMSCLPPINLGIALYLGFKGNELAWKAKPFASVQQFKETQRAWTIAGVIVFAISLIAIPMIAIMAAVAIPNFLHARNRAQFVACTEQLMLVRTAAQEYIAENGTLMDLESVDGLCIHIIPGMETPEDCAGEIKQRVDNVCKADTLKFEVTGEDSYEIQAEPNLDKYCPICVTEAGPVPDKYGSCDIKPACAH